MKIWGILAAVAVLALTGVAAIVAAVGGAPQLPVARPISPYGPVAVIGGPPPEGPRPVNAASFTYPQSAVLADDGTIYVANSLGLAVEAVRGDTIERVLGQTGVGSGFNRYNDVALDGEGGLLVADADKSMIIRIDLDSGEVTRTIDGPRVAGGVQDYFFISSLDSEAGRLLIVGAPVRPVAGSYSIGIGNSAVYEYRDGQWSQVAGLPSGEPDGYRAAIYTSSGGIAAILGSEFLVRSPDGKVSRINIGASHGGGILELSGGSWLVGAHTNLLKIDPTLTKATQVPIEARIANIGDINPGPGDTVLIADTDAQAVFVVDLETGETLRQIGGTTAAAKIVDFAATDDGDVLMLENSTPRIYRYDPDTGSIAVAAGNGRQVYSGPKAAKDFSFQYPSGLAVGPDGAIYATEANYRIVRIKDGQATIFAGDIHPGTPQSGQHRTEARFGSLRGIDVDEQSRVWVIDQGNHTLWRIETDSSITRIMGTGEPGTWEEGALASTQPLRSPLDVLLRDNGTVLIADAYNSVIAEIGTDGRVRRFAGQFHPMTYQGQGKFGGDGGPAAEAVFNTPVALAEDAYGNVYVLDQFNDRVRRITPDGIIETVAGGAFGVSDDASRFNHAAGIGVVGDHLYAADTGNSTVWAVPIDPVPEL